MTLYVKMNVYCDLLGWFVEIRKINVKFVELVS